MDVSGEDANGAEASDGFLRCIPCVPWALHVRGIGHFVFFVSFVVKPVFFAPLHLGGEVPGGGKT
jgi:hypothetical protein